MDEINEIIEINQINEINEINEMQLILYCTSSNRGILDFL